MKEELNYHYSKNEEKLNIITHAIGLLISCVGLLLLIIKSFTYDSFFKTLSLIIYGFSLVILYAASTLYHAAKTPSVRRKLNIFDHAAIYVLIAGTYTPFTIIILQGTIGWTVLGVTWTFALIGIILKFFYTGRYDKLSTSMYLLMGWQIIFVIKPLANNLSSVGLKLLITGGVFYTIGAFIYSLKKMNYNHAIFHVFVVLGSLSHFFCVYYFL